MILKNKSYFSVVDIATAPRAGPALVTGSSGTPIDIAGRNTADDIAM